MRGELIASASAMGPPTQAAVTAAKAAASVAGGFAGGSVNGGNIESAVMGAFQALAFFSVGEMNLGSGTVSNVGAHAAVGCMTAEMGGGKCSGGALSAGFAEFAGPRLLTQNMYLNAAVHATLGGIGSRVAGGKFANGAMTGAFGYLFNCVNHDCGSPESNAQGLSNTAGDTAGMYALGGLLGGTTAAAAVGPALVGATYEAIGGMSLVRYTGASGEALVGWIGEKATVLSATGRKFIADGVTHASVHEVKNVAALSLTPQIRAFGDHAVQTGRQFVLWIRSDTVLSGPLKQYLANIGATTKTIPGK